MKNLVEWPTVEDFSDDLKNNISDEFSTQIESATALTDRAERSEKQSELEEQVIEKFLNEEEDNTIFEVDSTFNNVIRINELLDRTQNE